MTLFARPTDAELLAKLDAKRSPDKREVRSDRKCEYCRTPMAVTDETCPKCYREPLEKSEQAEVVKLYRAYGCHIYNLSQARATKQTPGLPDLWVSRGKHAWWHECKRPVSGKPSTAQVVFHDECVDAGIPHYIGGIGAAQLALVDAGAAVFVSNGIEPSRK